MKNRPNIPLPSLFIGQTRKRAGVVRPWTCVVVASNEARAEVERGERRANKHESSANEVGAGNAPTATVANNERTIQAAGIAGA